MSALTRQCAFSLERANLYQIEKDREKQIGRLKNLLEQISHSASRILVPLSLDETFFTIVEESKKIFQVPFGSIFLLEGGLLKRRYASASLLYRVKLRKNGKTYKTFHDQKVMLYYTRPKFDPHPVLSRLGIKTVILIPLCFEDKPIGVLNMLSST